VRATLCYDDAKVAWLPFDRFVEGRHSSGGCASVSSLNKSLLSLVPWLILNMTEHDLVLDSAEYPPPPHLLLSAVACGRDRAIAGTWRPQSTQQQTRRTPLLLSMDGTYRRTNEHDTIRYEMLFSRALESRHESA